MILITTATVNDDGSIDLLLDNGKGVFFTLKRALVTDAGDFGLWKDDDESFVTIVGAGCVVTKSASGEEAGK